MADHRLDELLGPPPKGGQLRREWLAGVVEHQSGHVGDLYRDFGIGTEAIIGAAWNCWAPLRNQAWG